jgi:hypothetical protein
VTNALAHRDQRESSQDGPHGIKCQLRHPLSVLRRQTRNAGSPEQGTRVRTLRERSASRRVNAPAHRDQRESSQDGPHGIKCLPKHSLSVPRRQTPKLQAAGDPGTGVRASREVSQARCRDGCRYANPSAGLQAGHSGPRGRWPATADSPAPPRARLAGSHPLR